MARKGKPWGPSNPLWRYQHRKKKKRRTKARKTGAKRMARRYYGRRRRGRRSKGIPVLSLAIVLGQGAMAISEGGMGLAALGKFGSYYTGFDASSGTFEPGKLLVGWGPWVAKGFAGKLARAVGARPRLFPGLSLS